MVEYRVQAYNTATESDNKIHDDAVARRFGFRGGLVPGVDVYAYVTHPIVAYWGRPWLERGTVSVRFLQPVYDGEEVAVELAAADGAIELTVRNPNGDACASARATLPPEPASVDLAAYPCAPLPATRPSASAAALPSGMVLGCFDSVVRADRITAYLTDIRETLPLYTHDRIAHPAYLLRNANYVLAANVQLGPWIHVGSEVRHCGVAAVGDRVQARGRVMRTYERKGHQFVELDLVLVSNDVHPVMQIVHTAIYQPRQSRA